MAKKILWKTLRALRVNFQTKKQAYPKNNNIQLENISAQTSLLVEESKKENLKLPESAELILKATDSLIRYTLEKEDTHLNESIK